MLSTAAAGAIIGLGGVAHAQVVQLSVKTGTGTWSVYANDSNSLAGQTANAGIADFDIDVIGAGVTVTSPKVATPLPNSDADYGDTDGFDTTLSNGTTTAGSDLGITAAQFPAYSGNENPENDEVVIQGFGQVSSSATVTDYWSGAAPTTTTGAALWGASWTQTTQGVLVADGKYTGTAGTLTAQADPTALAGFQTLDIVSNGVWFGPGNTANATTLPGTAQIGSSVIAASAIQLFGTTAVGSSLGPEAVETGSEPYNLFKDTESTPVDSGYLQFTGFHVGDSVDLLLKFGLTNGSGDPATGQTLSDIINYINANDGTEGVIAGDAATSAADAALLAEYPGYDLVLSAPAPAGDPFADLNFGGFSADGIAPGTLGVAGLALVPEPASVSLLVLGGLGLMSRRRNRKNEA
jgi:hypothetical protein